LLKPLPASASAPVSPVLTLLAEADKDARECEMLLKRAIEMVRGVPRRMPTRAAAINSKPARSVQILYDPDDATFVAVDADSGLSVLRKEDISRLRAMCDRLGWRVVGRPRR
jgi:hypothetical protein